MWEMLEDTKEVSRSRKLKKDIQYNGQKKKNDKGRNDDPQNIAWKRKYHLKQGMNSGTGKQCVAHLVSSVVLLLLQTW